MTKRSLFVGLIAAAVTLWVCPALVMAVPACPQPAQLVQPDGTPITIYLRGDEYVHWNESADGYHITQNNRREWVYMVAQNGRPVASEHAVGKADPHAVGALKPDRIKLAEKGKQNRALRSATEGTLDSTQTPAAQEAPNLSQTTGVMYNLVVLVNFSDLTVAYPTSNYDALFNQVGYTTDGAVGSVKDYYHEVSYDTLTVQSVVVEPVTLDYGYAYYGANTGDPGTDIRPREMVAQALAKLETRGFDFTTVDGDSDGWIDGLTIIHAGGGEEYSGNNTNYIWSHQWAMISTVTYDGVSMRIYHTEPARRGWDSSPTTQGITRIGVICHENGHFLGLPDLYDYNPVGGDGPSRGAGDFCLMAGGSWNGNYGTTPAHMSAWCKTTLGWVTPGIVSNNAIYTLGRVETNPQVYKLQGAFPSTQYFLVENRQGFGFDAALPGSQRGLLIWHIDETQSNNNTQTHYMVDLEEASGTQHLELNQNDGDDADYFRTGNKTEFTSTTTPNNLSYSGVPLGLDITSVSATGTTMTFTVGTPVSPTPPVITSTPVTVAAVGRLYSYDVDASGSPPPTYALTTSPSGMTIDAGTGVIEWTAGTAGDFDVTVAATNTQGSDTQSFTITVSEISTMMLINGESFEGNWPPAGWAASGNWNKKSDRAYDQSFSAGFDGSGGGGASGELTTPDLDCSDALQMTVTFYGYDEGADETEYYLDYYNGTAWNPMTRLDNFGEGTWTQYSDTITDSQYFKSNFKIRWRVAGLGNNEHVYVDLVTVEKEAASTVMHTLTVSSSAGGSVTAPGEGAFPYNPGTVVDVNAAADASYHFVNWTGTAVAAGKVANPSSAATTVTMDNDYTIQANFAIDTFTLNYTAGAGGTLTGDTYQVVDFNSIGTPVTALPDTGYHFVDWSDERTDNPRTDVDVTANISVTANFAIDRVVISGVVTEPDPNVPIANVTIESAGEPNAITDPNGCYAFIVDTGWSGTLTPAKANYTFEPNSITYVNTAGDPNGRFTARLDTFIISGHAVHAGTLEPLEGVLVSPDNDGGPFTSKYYGGANVTDANGLYEVVVDCNFTGDVVASKYAYAFEPNGIAYTNVMSNIEEPNDYAGTLLTYAISGQVKNVCDVPIPDVLVQASSGGNSAVTDPNGYYEVWVDYNFSGTITPTKPHYTFAPDTIAYTDVLSNLPYQDYTAANSYDLDCDGSIALGDLAVLCGNWLQTGPNLPGDFFKDANDIVNFFDFADFAEVWKNE